MNLFAKIPPINDNSMIFSSKLRKILSTCWKLVTKLAFTTFILTKHILTTLTKRFKIIVILIRLNLLNAHKKKLLEQINKNKFSPKSSNKGINKSSQVQNKLKENYKKLSAKEEQLQNSYYTLLYYNQNGSKLTVEKFYENFRCVLTVIAPQQISDTVKQFFNINKVNYYSAQDLLIKGKWKLEQNFIPTNTNESHPTQKFTNLLEPNNNSLNKIF